MKKRNTISLLLVLALIAAVFAGCATSPPPAAQSSAPAPSAEQSQAPAASDGGGQAAVEPYELNVAWWGGDIRHKKTLEMIDIYMERNPEVKIVSEYAIYADYWTKMATRAAGGDMPDVYLVQLTYIVEYASKGLMRPLDDLIEAGKIDASNYTPGALSSSSYNGQVVGITFGDTAPCVMFNKTLIESVGYELPRDEMPLSEYAEYLKGLVPLMPADGSFVSDLDIQYDSAIEMYFKQLGAVGVVNEEKNVGYTEDMLRGLFNHYYDLFNAGVFGTVESTMEYRGKVWGDTPMGQGKVASWLLNVNQTKIFQATVEDELGMVRFPILDNATNKYVEAVTPSTWAISPNTQHLDGACQFIDTFVNDWELQKIYDMDIGVPGSTVIQEKLIAEFDANDKIGKLKIREIELMQQILDTIEPSIGRMPGYAAITDDIKKKFDEIIYGRMTVEEAVEAHFAAVPTLLA